MHVCVCMCLYMHACMCVCVLRDFFFIEIGMIYSEKLKINNKVLLDSTGNYIQYFGINHNGKEY